MFPLPKKTKNNNHPEWLIDIRKKVYSISLIAFLLGCFGILGIILAIVRNNTFLYVFGGIALFIAIILYIFVRIITKGYVFKFKPRKNKSTKPKKEDIQKVEVIDKK